MNGAEMLRNIFQFEKSHSNIDLGQNRRRTMCVFRLMKKSANAWRQALNYKCPQPVNDLRRIHCGPAPCNSTCGAAH